MKNILITLALLFSSTASFAKNSSDSATEYLGQCQLDTGGTFLVYQDLAQHTFKFHITTADSFSEVIFDRNLVWLWYEVDASFWKFRNGRHNGVFSWNFNTRQGHLKYVNGQYYYWHLNNCDINEKAIK